MRKRIKYVSMLLLLVGLFCAAGKVASHVHAATAPHKVVPQSCVGAWVTTTNGSQCLPPGTHEDLSGVTQICNDNQYPVNFVGSNGFYVIMPGRCQSLNAEDGTIYVDK